jgi:organic hydroperoxide reductase OsmC/OhrA
MDIAARKKRIALPADTAIDAEVDLCSDKGEYFLQARLNISIPGLEWDVSQQLVDEAHRTCPYTKAINGNVHVASSICCKAIYKPIIPSILKRSL